MSRWLGTLPAAYVVIGAVVAYACRALVAADLRRTGYGTSWQLYVAGVLSVLVLWPVVLAGVLLERLRRRRAP